MRPKDRIIITTGTYDPLTNEELLLLQKCKRKGDWLIVGVHSDWWMAWSEGGFVQNYEARKNIIGNLKCVDEVFSFNDSDGTVCQLLKIVKICYPNSEITYISGEDMHNMPETKIKGITFEIMKQEIEVTKFVGKFRKNKDYNDDYKYVPKRSKNEHAEIKKLKNRTYDELMSELEESSLPEKQKQF